MEGFLLEKNDLVLYNPLAEIQMIWDTVLVIHIFVLCNFSLCLFLYPEGLYKSDIYLLKIFMVASKNKCYGTLAPEEPPHYGLFDGLCQLPTLRGKDDLHPPGLIKGFFTLNPMCSSGEQWV